MEIIQELLQSIYDTFEEIGISYFRYTILCFLIFWVMFRERLTHFRIQPRPRVKSKLILKEIGYTFLTFIVIGTGGWFLDPIIFNHRFGLFYDNLYINIGDYGWGYFFLSVFLLLVFDDTYFYWAHRLMHHPKIYHHVHKIHHCSVDINPFTTYSFHPWEAAILFFGQLVIISIIPVHPLAVVSWTFLNLINAIVIHLGYEIYPRWFTKSWLTNWKTPCTHHNMHHERGNGNYALIFTWWDKLMATEFPDYESTVEGIQKRKLTS